MSGFRWVQQVPQYLWEGINRIFAPSDDAYPKTGVQPFEGDSAKDDDRFY
ncbi:isochorismate synthase [Oculatella sp. LEGE 06141]|nr:isochorismate synthase [Oculatella sp. LEGE 06141]MBE9181142.1 isochorismate synthase [Oculatella sp. LEGE 06141]